MGQYISNANSSESSVATNQLIKTQKVTTIEGLIPSKRIRKHFEVVCAIDIGTDGVALAYSLPGSHNQNESQEIILHKWKDKLATQYMKKRSQVLLNAQGNVRVFGEKAVTILTDLYDSDSNDEHQEEKNKENGYKLIENLKKSLYEEHKEKVIGLSSTIKAHDGTEYDTEQVFVNILKYLRKEAMMFIKKRLKKPNIQNDAIQWILTVPAIWNNTVKNNTTIWNNAVSAKMSSGQYINALRIKSEPECAALHIQYLMKTEEFGDKLNVVHSKNKFRDNYSEQKASLLEIPQLMTGDKYILIDAGRTVDIVLHEIINDFGFKELHPAKCGAYGSNIIDTEMLNMLYELFDKTNVDNFKEDYPQDYVLLIENMTWSKCQFNSHENKYHSIELPMNFITYMEKNVSNAQGSIEDLENYLKDVKSVSDIVSNEKLIYLTTDYLSIHKTVWMKWFDKCIDRILVDYNEIMNANNMNQIKYLFLVGGLAESKYFQQRIIQEIENITLLIPSRSMLSVVEGAARYGIASNFAVSSNLSKSYGIEIINNSQLILPSWKGTGALNVFATKGDEIYLNCAYTETYYRQSKQQQSVCVAIYESKQDEIPNMIYDEGVREIGHFTLQFPMQANTLDVVIQYSFNETMLVVTGYCRNHLQSKKRIDIYRCSGVQFISPIYVNQSPAKYKKIVQPNTGSNYKNVLVPITVLCRRDNDYSTHFNLTVPYKNNTKTQYSIGDLIDDIIANLEAKYKPLRFALIKIMSNSFIDYDIDYNEFINTYSAINITDYQIDLVGKRGMYLEIDIAIYEHKILHESICKDIQNGKCLCPIWNKVAYENIYTEKHLDHLCEYTHSPTECKQGDQCDAFKRLQQGGNGLKDRCHVSICVHPPRNRKINVDNGISSFCLNDEWNQNISLYHPTDMDKIESDYNE
eukprot:121349_1